ncbi:uncharacterized protein LOC103317307 isoform X1 [Nasonia vitripennis]|uniref:Uncharacterized protein n=1 Tax=Nasonia vitripennis TaxID=7425 RepID=A0A7M7HB34_NASVI|nr:uncharacterized protein LOC103317307 isoform X1 [Nasonia vitripennis]
MQTKPDQPYLSTQGPIRMIRSDLLIYFCFPFGKTRSDVSNEHISAFLAVEPTSSENLGINSFSFEACKMGNTHSSSDSDSDGFHRRNPWDEDDSDDSDESRRRPPSPPPKKPKLELKYNEQDNEEEDDDEGSEIEKSTYKSQHGTINVKYCDWMYYVFSYSDLFNEKGFIR